MLHYGSPQPCSRYNRASTTLLLNYASVIECPVRSALFHLSTSSERYDCTLTTEYAVQMSCNSVLRIHKTHKQLPYGRTDGIFQGKSLHYLVSAKKPQAGNLFFFYFPGRHKEYLQRTAYARAVGSH